MDWSVKAMSHDDSFAPSCDGGWHSCVVAYYDESNSSSQGKPIFSAYGLDPATD